MLKKPYFEKHLRKGLSPLSPFRVFYFTFPFSIKRTTFVKEFLFVIVQRKFKRMAIKDFVLVSKRHFPLSVKNGVSLVVTYNPAFKNLFQVIPGYYMQTNRLRKCFHLPYLFPSEARDT